MLPEGIQKGWKKRVRKMPAITSAQKIVFTVSMRPSPFFFSAVSMRFPARCFGFTVT